MSAPTSTSVSRLIRAPRDAIYRAYLEADAVAAWLPPGTMRGIMHLFEAREGGAFSMSLVYPESEGARGKTTSDRDTFRGRFVRLVPDSLVEWAVRFDAPDPTFAGEMTVRTLLEPTEGGTRVTIVCENIPAGIRPADNEAGCRLTLAQLAAFVHG